MKIKTYSIKLPKIFLRAYKLGLIRSVILFGSSLTIKHPKDIDLAIITTNDHFSDFIKLIKNNKEISKYDISLIKQEEINKNFYFGGHGVHLIESFKNGFVIIGDNPFIGYSNINVNEIKKSIFERMKEYIYVLRKSYFNKKVEKTFYSRYEKMLKLSLFLLTDNYKFPEILNISTKEAIKNLKNIGIILNENDKKENIENIWIKINKQYL